MPTVSEQIQLAHESALVISRPDLAIFSVTGDDRVSWLNGLVTCDVTKLAENRAQYGLVVSQKGRIVTDLFIVARANALFVVVPKRIREELMATLERYLVMEDAEMSPVDAEHVWLAVGPKAHAIANAAPCEFTGLGDAIILAETCEANGDRDGWQALRLEQGVPEIGVDFDEKTYPQEASLEKRAVSFDKGCYLGQEVVCMLELRGHVKRKLVPFVASAAIARGAAVTDDAGTEVGVVSSAGESPTRGAIGLAMIKLAHASAGAKLHVGNASITVGDPNGSGAA